MGCLSTLGAIAGIAVGLALLFWIGNFILTTAITIFILIAGCIVKAFDWIWAKVRGTGDELD